jgi:hypothetical protein
MTGFSALPSDTGAILAGACVSPCEPEAAPWILAATILASSMAFIDGTVVNVALPALQRDLNASLVDVQWVIEAYALFLAALLLVGGAAGDRFSGDTGLTTEYSAIRKRLGPFDLVMLDTPRPSEVRAEPPAMTVPKSMPWPLD